MARPSSLQERLTLTMLPKLKEYIEADAQLLGLERSEFIRQILKSYMDEKMHFLRSPALPKRARLSPRSRAKALSFQINVQSDLADWLHEMGRRLGYVSNSALAVLFIVDWIGINPLPSLFRKPLSK